MAFEGLTALPEAQRKRLGLHTPPPPAHAKAMAQEAMEAHCHMLATSAAGAMAAAQRVRDAHMALSMREASVKAGGRAGTVLIAGKGHTRRDRGVPWHLRQADPGVTTASVHFVEVPGSVTETDAAAMATESGGDYLWFTARVDDEDPCAKYRELLEKTGRGQAEP